MNSQCQRALKPLLSSAALAVAEARFLSELFHFQSLLDFIDAHCLVKVLLEGCDSRCFGKLGNLWILTLPEPSRGTGYIDLLPIPCNCRCNCLQCKPVLVFLEMQVHLKKQNTMIYKYKSMFHLQ